MDEILELVKIALEDASTEKITLSKYADGWNVNIVSDQNIALPEEELPI